MTRRTCCNATASAEPLQTPATAAIAVVAASFRISTFQDPIFRHLSVDVKSQRSKRFWFPGFRNSRTQIAAHCDDPVLMYRTKSTLRNLPGASSTFFTNEIHLRCAPNFQFPVSHVAASPHSHISIHLISSFPFPFRSSQAASNQFPVSSFQSCNLTALQGSISSFHLPGSLFHQGAYRNKGLFPVSTFQDGF